MVASHQACRFLLSQRPFVKRAVSYYGLLVRSGRIMQVHDSFASCQAWNDGLTPRRRQLSSEASSKNEKIMDNDDSSTRSSSKRVETEMLYSGRICHVKLSRPNKMNALDLPMFEAIAETAASLRDNRSLRAVILSGEGKAFCTGLDVKSIVRNKPFASMDRLLERPSGYERLSDDVGGNDIQEDGRIVCATGNLAQDVGYLWRDLPVPVIAVLHGMCFGGGMQIALGADFRFATLDCKLSIMEAKWGLIPDMSAAVTLRELVRIDVAKELAMTGRVILGTEAAELGLVTRCVSDPMEEAMQVCDEIIQRSPDSVAGVKRLYQRTWMAPEQECLEVETDIQKQLLVSYNQMAASGRNFGVTLPYIRRKTEGT